MKRFYLIGGIIAFAFFVSAVVSFARAMSENHIPVARFNLPDDPKKFVAVFSDMSLIENVSISCASKNVESRSACLRITQHGLMEIASTAVNALLRSEQSLNFHYIAKRLKPIRSIGWLIVERTPCFDGQVFCGSIPAVFPKRFSQPALSYPFEIIPASFGDKNKSPLNGNHGIFGDLSRSLGSIGLIFDWFVDLNHLVHLPGYSYQSAENQKYRNVFTKSLFLILALIFGAIGYTFISKGVDKSREIGGWAFWVVVAALPFQFVALYFLFAGVFGWDLGHGLLPKIGF